MGAARLHHTALRSLDGVRGSSSLLGPKFVDLASNAQENGYDGEVLADASDERSG